MLLDAQTPPALPERFGSIADGRAVGQKFFRWYNNEHQHSGLGFFTPAVVHFGQAPAVRAQRHAVLTAAYVRHPERFVNGPPQPADLPTAVWITPPRNKSTAQDAPEQRSSPRTAYRSTRFPTCLTPPPS